MTLAVLALICATTLLSSFISGVFGMAGGMVLLGVLLVYFDVATAMVLFSVIQGSGNGWRAFHWRRFTRWDIFFAYAAGGVVACALMRFVAFVPDKAMVYLTLGALPFAVEALPRRARPNIEWRGMPFITGVLTMIVQLLAGVGGIFLDLFFQKSMLDRKTTLGTKAVGNTFSHVLRGAYFGSFGAFGSFDPAVSLWWIAAAIPLAIAGNMLAPLVIERMSDHGFRQWTRAVIFGISTVYLVRAGWLYWHG